MVFDPNKLKALLKTATNHRVSDIHIRTNERPCFRSKGELVAVKTEPFNEEDILGILHIIIANKELLSQLDKICDLDGSYELEGVCRVRFNLMRYQGKLGLVMRVVSLEVPTLESLGLSSLVKKIASVNRGLVLVTGATGSGKSSTLAAMINYINTTRADHIVSIEDPVEFLHPQIKSRITQREIGVDTTDFKSGLRAALRQDPDVIFIGEMRDAETVSIALKAAETGHVVFATVHTTNAISTIGRILSMFPPEEHNTVRQRLADNLHSSISQRLLPTSDGQGLICAQEIMVTGPGIRECLVGKEDFSNINTFIENGWKDHRSHSFDQHITALDQKGLISLDVAKGAATSPENFERNLLFKD